MEMRRKDREITDIREIDEILKKAGVLRLALFDRDYPYIIPLYYGYEYGENRELIFYTHSAKRGHKIDVIGDGANACIELDCDTELFSGGDVACKYGSYFSSIVGRGRVTPVTDINEKTHALKLLMSACTGRNFDFEEKMANAVAIFKITVTDYNAKANKKRQM